MAILDKILGRKKPEPLIPPTGLEKGPDLGLGLDEPAIASGPTPKAFPQPPPEPISSPHQPTFAQAQHQAPQQMQHTSVEKDIQILNAKLDSLKAILDNINQRLANIERIAQESEHHESYENY